MTLEEYLSELGGQIRDDQARSFVEDEVRCHIMDQAEAYESDGMVREDALITAVREMGDPVSVGIDLDKIHRPHMEWRFLIYVLFISILNLGIQYLINKYISFESDGNIVTHFSGTSIISTFSGLSAMLVMYRLDFTGTEMAPLSSVGPATALMPALPSSLVTFTEPLECVAPCNVATPVPASRSSGLSNVQ